MPRRPRREVLARAEKDASQPWENPGTGARGTVTPLADAYTQDGFQCRDFLASYIREGAESWLQGDACRIHQGKWTRADAAAAEAAVTAPPSRAGSSCLRPSPRCTTATLPPH